MNSSNTLFSKRKVSEPTQKLVSRSDYAFSPRTRIFSQNKLSYQKTLKSPDHSIVSEGPLTPFPFYSPSASSVSLSPREFSSTNLLKSSTPVKKLKQKTNLVQNGKSRNPSNGVDDYYKASICKTLNISSEYAIKENFLKTYWEHRKQNLQQMNSEKKASKLHKQVMNLQKNKSAAALKIYTTLDPISNQIYEESYKQQLQSIKNKLAKKMKTYADIHKKMSTYNFNQRRNPKHFEEAKVAKIQELSEERIVQELKYLDQVEKNGKAKEYKPNQEYLQKNNQTSSILNIKNFQLLSSSIQKKCENLRIRQKKKEERQKTLQQLKKKTFKSSTILPNRFKFLKLRRSHLEAEKKSMYDENNPF